MKTTQIIEAAKKEELAHESWRQEIRFTFLPVLLTCRAAARTALNQISESGSIFNYNQ